MLNGDRFTFPGINYPGLAFTTHFLLALRLKRVEL
jgi:hypothetical protein